MVRNKQFNGLTYEHIRCLRNLCDEALNERTEYPTTIQILIENKLDKLWSRKNIGNNEHIIELLSDIEHSFEHYIIPMVPLHQRIIKPKSIHV